jgi:RNA polymerase sigma-70 factor (family 1)
MIYLFLKDLVTLSKGFTYLSYSALHNESIILRQIAEGSEEAFAELFDHYHPNIYTTVVRLAGDREKAEELVQDVFLKVWTNRKMLPEIQHFAAWLYTITTNETFTSLDKLKRTKKRMMAASNASDLIPHISIETPADHLEEKEYATLLHHAIQRLPEKQQLAYKMIREQGMSRQEVAIILGVAPETVKEHLSRAMKSVRSFCLENGQLLTLLLFIR